MIAYLSFIGYDGIGRCFHLTSITHSKLYMLILKVKLSLSKKIINCNSGSGIDYLNQSSSSFSSISVFSTVSPNSSFFSIFVSFFFSSPMLFHWPTLLKNRRGIVLHFFIDKKSFIQLIYLASSKTSLTEYGSSTSLIKASTTPH